MTHRFNNSEDKAYSLAVWEEALSDTGVEIGLRDADLSPSQDNFVTLVTRVPLRLIITSEGIPPADWEAWFQNEIAMHRKDGCGVDEHFLRMLACETVTEEIVVGCYPTEPSPSGASCQGPDQVRFKLWDGWHRTACSVIRREESIPALLVIAPQLIPQVLQSLGLEQVFEVQPGIEDMAP